MTIEELNELMLVPENEQLEFKAAKNSYEYDRLAKYCAALANGNGGTFVLGITDKIPRVIVGTSAFTDIEHTKTSLLRDLRLRVDIEVISHPSGRVLVFHVPQHSIGQPIAYKAQYFMRIGEDVLSMTDDVLKGIIDERVLDFSAELRSGASISDLDERAIEKLRALLVDQSGNRRHENDSVKQLLADEELMVDGKLTIAALILLGSRQALGKYLANSELVFEYRVAESSTSYQQREDYREGFLLYFDDLWGKINLRNEVFQYNEGFLRRNIPAFKEVVVREAVLNAATHRDYQDPASIFVRQFPRKLEIVSPGGFPRGITEENVLYRSSPRNRRIAEVLQKCGLVERSGQGVNRMFEECIKDSKPRPDFTGTDKHQVSVTLRGEVQDPQFLKFLGSIGNETLSLFTTQDFLILDLIRREQPIPPELRDRLVQLKDRGVIEGIGRGRGGRYILSRRYYTFIGEKGIYTRKVGLDRDTNRELLLKHIRDNGSEGSQFREFMQVLPGLTRRQIQGLVTELVAKGKIHALGRTSARRWYPGSGLTEHNES